MKKLFIIPFFLIALSSYSQFHLRVQPNPSNDGKVNPSWLNNYVIAYTTDNWKTNVLLHTQITWEGFDDNGKYFYTSSYDPISFQKQKEAIQLAKILPSIKSVRKYESQQYNLHLYKNRKFEIDNKNLVFNSNQKKTKKDVKPIDIY